MPNCRWYESHSKTHTVLTGYLKPEENRENSNDPPPQWYRYNRCDNTSINRWENYTKMACIHILSFCIFHGLVTFLISSI